MVCEFLFLLIIFLCVWPLNCMTRTNEARDLRMIDFIHFIWLKRNYVSSKFNKSIWFEMLLITWLTLGFPSKYLKVRQKSIFENNCNLIHMFGSFPIGQIVHVIRRVINANIPYVPWITDYLALLIGAIMTFLMQSSSVFTSTLTPLVGVGKRYFDLYFIFHEHLLDFINVSVHR